MAFEAETTGLMSKEQDRRRRVLVATINSVIMYTLAMLCMHLMYLYIKVIAGQIMGTPMEVFHNRINYMLDRDEWTRQHVLTFYGFPPLMCIAIAGISLLLFSYFKKSQGGMRIFLLWFTLQALVYGIGMTLANIITAEGFHYAMQWLYLNNVVRVIVALLCFAGLIIVGFFSSKSFLRISVSQSLVAGGRRRNFLTKVAFWPWVVGVIVFLALNFPTTLEGQATIVPSMIYVQFTMLLIIIPAIVLNGIHNSVRLIKHKNKRQIQFVALAFALFLIGFVKLYLARGLRM